MKNYDLEMLCAALGIKLLPLEKPARKCRLPACQSLTTHNGEYCSAAHCREHREVLRKR